MIGAHKQQSTTRGWIVIAVRWVAAILVLAVLLHFLPVAPLRSALTQVPLTRFVLILIGYGIAHLFGIVKWQLIVNAAGAELDFKTSAQCYTGGLFGTLFLPSIVGGDVVRLAVGLRRSPRPAAVFAGNVADRFLDVCAQAGLVFLGLILLPGSVPQQLQSAVRRVLLALAVVGIIFAVLGLLLYKPILRGRSIRF